MGRTGRLTPCSHYEQLGALQDRKTVEELINKAELSSILPEIDAAILLFRKSLNQNIELEDMDLTLRLNNDMRKTVKFEIEGSFVDNNPVDAPTVFELSPRGSREIVPSNVRSKSIIKTGKARFARLMAT